MAPIVQAILLNSRRWVEKVPSNAPPPNCAMQLLAMMLSLSWMIAQPGPNVPWPAIGVAPVVLPPRRLKTKCSNRMPPSMRSLSQSVSWSVA